MALVSVNTFYIFKNPFPVVRKNWKRHKNVMEIKKKSSYPMLAL